MTTDKELIRMIQRSALTIYEHAEKMAGNYSTQTGLDIGIRIRFGELVEITVDQTLLPEGLYDNMTNWRNNEHTGENKSAASDLPDKRSR